MTVRAEMQPLIDRLRHLTQAATTDKFGGQTFWSDLQLQGILEDNYVSRQFLIQREWGQRGKVRVRTKRWMIDTSKAAVLGWDGNVLYEDISELGTYDQKTGTFDDYDAEAQSLAGGWIDLWSAAADVWEAKAAQRYHFSQIKAGANTIRMQNQYQHCVQQRDYYRSKIIGRSG